MFTYFLRIHGLHDLPKRESFIPIICIVLEEVGVEVVAMDFFCIPIRLRPVERACHGRCDKEYGKGE
jgi:hypothetical protein